ncbi:DUF3383 domain-containing protein [Orbaceae bacterium ac157xtp]
MAISLNRLIKVNPSVIRAVGNAIDLNGVILSDNNFLPVGTPLEFSGADTVKEYFGSSSDEYKAAKIYFQGVNNGTTTPSKLYFARFNRQDSNAFLVGGNLNLTLSQLKAINGDISLSINGVTQTKTVNLSAATSFLNAAVLLENALNNVSVDYNELTKQFKITTVGSDAKNTEITHATGELAKSLGLTLDTGAYVSMGAKAKNADDFFSELLSKTANWYSFTTLFEPTEDLHLDLAGWVSAQKSRFNYVMWTSSGTALVANSKETILYKIKQANYASVTPVYAKSFDKSANVLGYYASLNFNQVNGKVQLAYRTLDGLKADIVSNAEYDALVANGYNFYGSYAANIDSYLMWQSGHVTGDFMWADTHAGQAWLNASIQLTILNVLMANMNIPYSPVGKEMFASPLVSPLEQFKSWGGCVTGTDLDNSQKLQIKQLLGYDAAPALTAKGYIIHIGKFTSTMRANRTTPPCYVLYADGGAFRTIELNSVEVQ